VSCSTGKLLDDGEPPIAAEMMMVLLDPGRKDIRRAVEIIAPNNDTAIQAIDWENQPKLKLDVKYKNEDERASFRGGEGQE